MPRQVRVHQLTDLSHDESKNEILLNTKQNTELGIIAEEDRTVIWLPFGNKFDIIDRRIIIYEK